MELEEALSSSTTAETPEQSTTEVVPPKLHLHFLDLNGDAISGLDVRVTIWDLPKTYITNCEGLIEDIEGPANAKLRIEVQRFDGSFKVIDDCLMPASSNTWWQYLSPQILLDVETVEHAGDRGDIKQSIPVPVPSDEGQRPEAQTDETPVLTGASRHRAQNHRPPPPRHRHRPHRAGQPHGGAAAQSARLVEQLDPAEPEPLGAACPRVRGAFHSRQPWRDCRVKYRQQGALPPQYAAQGQGSD
jgi:hypothetical protein